MSHDRSLFQAPPTPEPPQGLHYEQPKPSLKPIFPWESRARKPTRVFAEDLPPPPAPEPVATPTGTETSTTAESGSPTVTSPGALSTANAWDNNPAIMKYVSGMSQNRQTKFQNILSENTTPLTSPPVTEHNTERRPSKVTDFPTEIERPSLPVTPAPVHRRSFWGAERDEAGALPAAEGVPEQSEWDPVARLLELQQKQAGMLGQGSEADARTIPDREAISSAAEVKPVQVISRESSKPDDEDASTKAEGLQTTTSAPLKEKEVDAEPAVQSSQKTTSTPLKEDEATASTQDVQKTTFSSPKDDGPALDTSPEISGAGIGAQKIMEQLQKESAAR